MTLLVIFSDFTCASGIHKYNIAYMTHIVQWCICMPGKALPKQVKKHGFSSFFHHFLVVFT